MPLASATDLAEATVRCGTSAEGLPIAVHPRGDDIALALCGYCEP